MAETALDDDTGPDRVPNYQPDDDGIWTLTLGGDAWVCRLPDLLTSLHLGAYLDDAAPVRKDGQIIRAGDRRAQTWASFAALGLVLPEAARSHPRHGWPALEALRSDVGTYGRKVGDALLRRYPGRGVELHLAAAGALRAIRQDAEVAFDAEVEAARVPTGAQEETGTPGS